MDAGKADGADKIERFLRLLFRLAGKAGEHVRGDGAAGQVFAQAFDRAHVLLWRVAAAHARKHARRAALHGEVELRHDAAQLRHAAGEFVGDGDGFQRAEAHARHGLSHGADGAQQRIARAPAIAGQVDAGNDDLRIAGFGEAAGFGAHIFQRHGAHRAAHRRDDAVGTVAVATLLDLHRRAGLALVAGDEEVFKRRALERGDGVDGAFAPGALEQLHHFGAALHADDQRHIVHLQKRFRLALGEAAGDDDGAAWMFARHAADEFF